jgi:ketosteroid isomerase-like protein
MSPRPVSSPIVGAVFLFVAAACSDAGIPAAASSSASSAGSGAAPQTSASAAATASAIDEARVKNLVADWLGAQNNGDFAAYQKLYAQKLEGIKRSGPKTWRFDRKGFLADRERMFRKPMIVEAKDVTVRVSAASATVELEQRFKQDKFEDEGPKRMVLVLEHGELRIAREEMLSSIVASGGTTEAQPVRFIQGGGDGTTYLFIGDGDASWASGPARMLNSPLLGASYTAIRGAEKAPASAKSWKNRTVTAYDGAGKSCEATVRELALIGGGTPHFGEVQMWDGMIVDGKPTEPVLGPAERAKHVFGMTTPYLVGELEIPAGCGASLAMEAKSPKFFARTQVAAGDAGSSAAQDAFKKLASYQDAQTRFITEARGTGDWAKTVTVEGFEGHSRRFIAVSAEVLAGCAEFNASVTALFEITGASKAVLVAEGVGTPYAIFDSDDDGKVELVVDERGGGIRYLVQSGSEMTATATIAFPFNDCGC